jgi:hypothetical protein
VNGCYKIELGNSTYVSVKQFIYKVFKNDERVHLGQTGFENVYELL